MKRHRIENIQALRALAALLVVGRHLQVYMERAAGGPPVLGRFHVGDMGVDLFFVISGCILVLNHEETFTRAGDAVRFLYRRAVRIYPLYWLYSLPALAIYLWRPQWLHRLDQGMAVHLGRSFVLWPQRSWPLLGQAWSLVDEIYFYLVFAALAFLPGRWFRRGLLAWAGVVVAGYFFLAAHPALERPEWRLAFEMLTLEFIAGALVGLSIRRVPAWRAAAPAWLAVGLGGIWVARVVLPLGMPVMAFDRLIEYGLPCVAAVYGATLLEAAGVRAPRALTVIGDWSYSIYLSHIFVIAALAHWLPTALAANRFAQVALEAVLVAAVLLVGACSYRYLETPLSRLTRQRFPAGFRQIRWRPGALPITNRAAP